MTTDPGAPVNIGIIGAGQVSDYHHAPAIQLDPRATLVGLCDSDPALLEKRKKDWDVEFVTTELDELLAADIDAVIIATPNFTHRDQTVASARAGKHIMCEKPLGVSSGEAREMYEAARDAGVVHMTLAMRASST